MRVDWYGGNYPIVFEGQVVLAASVRDNISRFFEG
jgi:hypothetical protein